MPYSPFIEKLYILSSLTSPMFIILYTHVYHFTGAMLLYGRLQSLLWWIFQSGTMLYGVVRPLQYRSKSDSGKLKYVHLSFLAAGIGLPLIPVLICQWFGGYGISVLVNYRCLPRNMSAMIYAFFFPTSILGISGLAMLLFIGYKLGIKVTYDI